MRQLNFKKEDDLPLETIKDYVLEAIQNQKDGKEIKIAIAPKSTKDVAIPDLLKTEKNSCHISCNWR